MSRTRLGHGRARAFAALIVFAVVAAACGSGSQAGSGTTATTAAANTTATTAAANTPATTAAAVSDGTGCTPSTKDSFTLAFVPKALNNPVFEITRQGAEDRAAELGNVKIRWVGPSTTDAAAQSQILDDLVTQGVDGIVLSANAADALAPAIDRAVDAGIPVATWDSDSPTSKRLTNVAIDQEAAGRRAGELLLAAVPSGKVAVLTGTPGALNLEQRLKGFEDAVAANPDIEIVAVDPDFDDVQKAVEIVEQRINATPDLAGYYFVGMWPFFADLESMPNLKKFVGNGGYVVSLDSLEGALNAVDQGYATELVGYSWWQFGVTSVDVLMDYLTSCTMPPDPMYTKTYVVDRSNIAEYLAKQKATGGAF